MLDIGKNIKQRRESLSWSQKELAERVHVNNTMICQIERGSTIPNTILLLAIAKEFQCSLDDLVK